MKIGRCCVFLIKVRISMKCEQQLMFSLSRLIKEDPTAPRSIFAFCFQIHLRKSNLDTFCRIPHPDPSRSAASNKRSGSCDSLFHSQPKGWKHHPQHQKMGHKPGKKIIPSQHFTQLLKIPESFGDGNFQDDICFLEVVSTLEPQHLAGGSNYNVLRGASKSLIFFRFKLLDLWALKKN